MQKVLSAAAGAALLVMMAAPVLAWSSSTTRIETRPYYGATVTIESGVRVFRAIPPTRHMIINPHGQTPLNLGINETHVEENSTSHNYYYDEGGVSGGAYPVGVGGFVGGVPRHGRRGVKRGPRVGGFGAPVTRGHRGGGRRGGHH